MKQNALGVAAVLAVSIAMPVSAQVRAGKAGEGSTPPKPEAVVARLMSFDQDGDGRVTRAELPERMYGLLPVGASASTGLDAGEVLRIAQHPPSSIALRDFEPGHYGFAGVSGFDTRLHIEGAIEDLRLADARRGEAIGIARTFLERDHAQARRTLLASAASVLNAEQLAAFKRTLDRPIDTGVLSVIVGEGSPALKAMITRSQRVRSEAALSVLVSQFALGAAGKHRMLAALVAFKAHDELSDFERLQLVNGMRGVLTAQERNDLRAALERRPVVKQEASVMSVMTASGEGFVAVGGSVSRE